MAFGRRRGKQSKGSVLLGREQIDIVGVDPQTVWELLRDPKHGGRFDPDFVSGRIEPGGQAGTDVGDVHVTHSREADGTEHVARLTVIDGEPNRWATAVDEDGHTYSWLVEWLPGGTRLTMTFELALSRRLTPKEEDRFRRVIREGLQETLVAYKRGLLEVGQ